MRIALNASILRAPRTGIGQYVAGLAAALKMHEDVELSLFLGRDWSADLPAIQTPATSSHSLARVHHMTWLRHFPGAYRVRRAVQQHAFNGGVRRSHVDLYHEPSLWPYETDVRMVMTLHDLTHVHYPETQPAARLREIERHVHRGVERARYVLVDSDYIGREVETYFGLSRDKIVVAPLGCDAGFHPRTTEQLRTSLVPLGLQQGAYLLCVGTLEPRKNIVLALRAHARLPQALRERYSLLLVGGMGWNTGQFSEELRAALATGHVRLTGYLSQENLAAVVAGARALIYPSLYEGFGLPVLEAMASGTPVIVSNRAALPEVAGDAGLIVDAEDDVRLSLAMQMLIEDEAVWQTCRQEGLQQAAQFTWSRCAEITAHTYRAALTG